MSLLRKSLVSTLLASSLLIPMNFNDDEAFAATQTPPVTPPTEQPAGDPPSGENVQANEVIEEIEAQTPASVTGETMQGNGTVVDYTTSGSKAFYTIVDTEQNTFYLIIDMDKTQNNVYFLKDVNQSDLEGVATSVNEGVAPTPPPNLTEPETEVEPEETNSGLGFGLIVLLLAAIGVAAYYFLVMRKRHQNKDDNTEDDEMEEYYDDDFEDEENEVDLSKKDK